MKVLVFGAGALGTLLGAHLATRYDVHLVGREPHVQAVRGHGVRVTGSVEFTAPCGASTEAPRDWIPDLILVSVKAYDTPAAIEGLAGRIGPRTVVLTVQNGLGNLEALRAAFPQATVLGASVVYGARLDGPGHVVATGSPKVTLGGRQEDRTVAYALAEALTHAGLPATAVDDVRGALLAKALVNSIINPLTALHGVVNGRLIEDPELKRRFAELAAEGQAIMDAVDYEAPIQDLAAAAEGVARMTAGNRSSMLQDADRGGRTEIEAITGEVVRLAKALGVPVPHNESMLKAMRARESARLSHPSPGR